MALPKCLKKIDCCGLLQKLGLFGDRYTSRAKTIDRIIDPLINKSEERRIYEISPEKPPNDDSIF